MKVTKNAIGKFLHAVETMKSDLAKALRSRVNDKLNEHHHNVNISKVVGSSVGILGGVASIARIVLTLSLLVVHLH